MAAAKQLARNVTVGGDTFPAGTKVGDEVNGVKFTSDIAASIENDKAWDESDDGSYVEAAAVTPPPAETGTDGGSTDTAPAPAAKKAPAKNAPAKKAASAKSGS